MKPPTLTIDIGQIPPEGRRLAGSIDTDFYELGKDDPRPDGPMVYDFTAKTEAGTVLLTGDFEAVFQLECARCLERFPFRVELLDFTMSAEPENGVMLDLTAVIREDILLALPRYPRCDRDGTSPRECPAKGEFAQESEFSPIAGEDQVPASGMWDALDQLEENKED